MRNLLLLVLPLLACSASASGPLGDAGGDTIPDATGPDATCDFTRQRLVPGRGCVNATADDCDGMRCPRPMICNLQSAPEGGVEFVCITD